MKRRARLTRRRSAKTDKKTRKAGKNTASFFSFLRELPGKKLSAVLVALLVFFLVLGLARRMPSGQLFPVRRVSVTGIHSLDREALQRILTPLVHRGFFSLDPRGVRERLLALPWVAEAMVQRIWPDQVKITLREKVPLALWNDSYLISTAGDVFFSDTRVYADRLPHFVGPAGSQMRLLSCYRALLPHVKQLGTGIHVLELTPDLSWRVVLENRLRLHLGARDVLTHLRHFVKVYPGVVGSRVSDVEYVDLHYPDGFAVRWKQKS